MSFDLNNDPNRPISRDPNLNQTSMDTAHLHSGKSRSWVGWVATIVVLAIAAIAIYQWTGAPNTDPQSTASTTTSEPAPAQPMNQTGTNATPAPAPAPATPSTGGAQQ